MVNGREEMECRQYAAMVVERSASQEQGSEWRMAMAEKRLSKNGEWILERTKIIMDGKSRKNKWNGAVSALVIGAMVMLNSLTALAYEEVKTVSVESEEDYSGKGIVDGEFVENGKSGSRTEFLLYDEQFVGEDGNIYPVITDQSSTYITCKHTYVFGIYQEHEKHSDGGCTMIYYEGQRCSKCGNLIIEKEAGKVSYTKCIH